MTDLKFLAFVLVVSSLVMADDAEDTKTVSYNAEQFNEEVAKKNHFVMFYAPWCGHCKRLHPTWDELASKYNEGPVDGADVVIAKVDCTVETSLCSDNDVTGYPTLKFFKKDSQDSAVKYRGQRDLKSFTTFIAKQLGLIEEEVISEPEIAVADKGLYVLNDKSFANHIKTGDHFVKFYAPWCGHCQKLAPTWDDLAKKFADDKVVKISKLDCTNAQSICQDQGVKGYPTLVYYRDGKKVEAYRGARNLNDLADFVKSMQEEKTNDKKEQPEEPPVSPVTIVNADNFKEAISKGVTFVKFYAPWCGHCKRLSPTWDELAKKYEANNDVTIAKVDCTSNDNKNQELCKEQEVNGFPTLHIYKDGKRVNEYNGKRELDELTTFVDKTISGETKEQKDEL